MLATITYKGNLRTEAVHARSGSRIETDAPVDNQGKGERFSPTDLVAASVASCMLTIMGIYARDKGIDMSGVAASVEKVMGTNPRRISEVHVAFYMTSSGSLSNEQKKALELVSQACPVSKSLHPDIVQVTTFTWK